MWTINITNKLFKVTADTKKASSTQKKEFKQNFIDTEIR